MAMTAPLSRCCKVLVVLSVVLTSGCESKAFRGEVVFTKGSKSQFPEGPTGGSGVSTPGSSSSSPLPRTVGEVNQGAATTESPDDTPAPGTSATSGGPAIDNGGSGNEGGSSSAPPDSSSPEEEPETPTNSPPPTASEEPTNPVSSVDVEPEPAATMGSSTPGEPNPAPLPEPEPGSEPEPGADPEPAAEPEPAAVPETPFSKAELLEAIAECTVTSYDAFREDAKALRDAAVAYAADRSAEKLLATQQAWLTAMLTWQRAEFFQFGPAALPGAPGGRGLRDNIYAWNGNPPGSNRCRIETQIVNRAYESANFGTSLIVARTLSAFEFLTFYAGSDTSCTQFDDIVANGTWAALSDVERAQRRADYAAAIAKDVATRAETLFLAWSASGDNFSASFASAGAGNALFPTQQSALNAVSDAFFYLDKEVKDAKLGMPLGLMLECPRASCPEALESQYARVSTLFLYENLNGFEQLFTGCGVGASGLGFDDWLQDVGAADLANRMQLALDNAQALVANLDLPVEDALLSEPAKVADLHAAMKNITDLMKTEFITVLNLELPMRAEGDND